MIKHNWSPKIDKCRYTYYTLFLCLHMENGEVKQNQANQQNIGNNTSTISPTSDEEMRHASNTSTKCYNFYILECLFVKIRHFF